ncbi:hypothetical protein [Cohnella cellulosilytica]|uniref:Uncharacterized protein n=1 Tax=Cohnella cellulosilytica TaxID=986710 RepID=A0ABW2FAM6_9BACL
MYDADAPEERRTYYISVGPGQILEDSEAAAFEFAIHATEAEIDKLEELFQEAQDADTDEIFNYSGSPLVSDSPENETYDALFKDIYRMLHELGTDETKRHIESMNIL